MSKFQTIAINEKAAESYVDMLTDVLAQQSYSGETKSFRKWIAQWCRANIPHDQLRITVNNGNLYVVKGKADVYPCQVSHIDTVHKIRKSFEIYRSGNVLFAFDGDRCEQAGIGGDDKVGVFVCLFMLKHLPAVKCVFFRDEEIGCVGSNLAVTRFFNDCAFILQCDRRGGKDFVSNITGLELQSTEFKEAISDTLAQYGYAHTQGMMTDVEALKNLEIPLCMANMSCGYYEPHSDSEVVNIMDVMRCTAMCYKLHTQFADKQWKHVAEKKVGKYNWDDYTWERVGSKYGKNWNISYEQGRIQYPSSKGDVTKYQPSTGTWHDGKRAWHDKHLKWNAKLSKWHLDEIGRQELEDTNLLNSGLVTGDGQYRNPFRYVNVVEIGDRDDNAFNNDFVKASKHRHKDHPPQACDRCGTGFYDMIWDEIEGSWYCMSCYQYQD